ncbi:proton-conducting transporter membrane subunit [Olivibacter sitiensis]|uniref:proton-conducting transporter transmembrane domain-containing protein n=1 Tax=Olivibacter sitiensis TaxID=376470 RepID=UPI0004041437|nr:proton-conducting transporter membrane subunit [Olivibacter sitiensis]
MIDNTIIYPVVAQLVTAIILLFFWGKSYPQRFISILGSLVVLLMSITLFSKVWSGNILIMESANWKPPFGIVFVADVFSSTMVLITSIVAFAVSIYSSVGIGNARQRFGYFPLFHFLMMGLNGAFLTGDIFNLYVFFEVIIISSFVLMTLGGRKTQLEGAVKYMAMNILASTIFLTGIGILYGITGTLNMADLAVKVPLVENRNIIDITAIFFLVGFGIKSAVFPLYYWLPSSYHTPPSAVAAVFGGLLTKVGVYAILRIFTLIFVPNEFMKIVLTVLSVMTIISGGFGALIKRDVRRIFSYLIVCHIGFMIGGIALFTPIALSGVLFYLIHDILVKTNIFLISGLIRNMKGNLNTLKAGGLYARYPKISLVMALVFFSLVGVPPLSGFWPKIYLFEAGFTTHNYFFIAALIIGSFLTLYIMARLWSDVFWKNPSEGDDSLIDHFKDYSRWKQALLVIPICLLAIATLYVGLAAENIVVVVKHIAAEMIDTSPYIDAVLGNK